MSKPILKLSNIEKTYEDGFTAIENFNLEIFKGEFVTLLGPSGCGKTSILKIIGGFELPTKGKILYNGLDIKDLPIIERPTSTVFQDYALFPNMTVEENIKYGLRLMRTPLEDVPEEIFKQSIKVMKDAKKHADKKIHDVNKKRKILAKELKKLDKKYEKNEYLSSIKKMRRTQYLTELEYLDNKLYEKYGDDYITNIKFQDKLFDFINGCFSRIGIEKRLKITIKDMNEIEKEINELKRWYRFKTNLDNKYDKISDKYNDLDYWISYWENYPQLKKESFEKRKITRKLNKEEIDKRFNDVIKLVGLENKEKNMPSELSGGMQQRVALARSIVIEPEIILLDEPLSALDAKVRNQLQSELKRLHKELGITFILVTHDQEEALMLSDKIVVMSEGKIEQIGSANQIYDMPENLWVASFIGRTNIFDAKITKDDKVAFCSKEFDKIKDYKDFKSSDDIKLMIRPEDFIIVKNKTGFLNNIKVKEITYKGLLYDIVCEFDKKVITVEGIKYFAPGSLIGLNIDPEDIHLIKV